VQQVPFTHPPCGVPGALPRRKARQHWLLGGGVPAAAGAAPPKAQKRAVPPPAPAPPPRHPNVRYCHAFAEGRTCRAGEHCLFPHISLEHVEHLAHACDSHDGGGAYLAQLNEYVAKRRRA
jgi:hypothetical protein